LVHAVHRHDGIFAEQPILRPCIGEISTLQLEAKADADGLNISLLQRPDTVELGGEKGGARRRVGGGQERVREDEA
jgi:hypothetical protein